MIEPCGQLPDLRRETGRKWRARSGHPVSTRVTSGADGLSDLFWKLRAEFVPTASQSIVHISRMDQDDWSALVDPNTTEFCRRSRLYRRVRPSDPIRAGQSVGPGFSQHLWFCSKHPAGYPLEYDQMTAEDLILQAGGFQRGAIPWEVEIVRPIFAT